MVYGSTHSAHDRTSETILSQHKSAISSSYTTIIVSLLECIEVHFVRGCAFSKLRARKSLSRPSVTFVSSSAHSGCIVGTDNTGDRCVVMASEEARHICILLGLRIVRRSAVLRRFYCTSVNYSKIRWRTKVQSIFSGQVVK